MTPSVFPNQNLPHLVFYLLALTVLFRAFRSLGLILSQASQPFGMFLEQRPNCDLVMSLSGTPKKWEFTTSLQSQKILPNILPTRTNEVAAIQAAFKEPNAGSVLAGDQN